MEAGNYILVTDDEELLKRLDIFSLKNFPSPSKDDTVVFISKDNNYPPELKNTDFIFIPLTEKDKKLLTTNLALNLFVIKNLAVFFYEDFENIYLKIPERISVFSDSKFSKTSFKFMSLRKNLAKFLGIIPYSFDKNFCLIYFLFLKDKNIKVYRKILLKDKKEEILKKYSKLKKGNYYNLDNLFKKEELIPNPSENLKIYKFIGISETVRSIYDLNVQKEKCISDYILNDEEYESFWDSLQNKTHLYEVFNIKPFRKYRLEIDNNTLILVDFSLKNKINQIDVPGSIILKILNSSHINDLTNLILKLNKTSKYISKDTVNQIAYTAYNIGINKDSLQDLYVLISLLSKENEELPEDKFSFLIKELISLTVKIAYRQSFEDNRFISLNTPLFEGSKEFLDFLGKEDKSYQTADLKNSLIKIIREINKYFWKKVKNYKGRSNSKTVLLKRFVCLLPYFYQILAKSYFKNIPITYLIDNLPQEPPIKDDNEKALKNKLILSLEKIEKEIESIPLELLEDFILNFATNEKDIEDLLYWKKNKLSLEALTEIFKRNFLEKTGIVLNYPQNIEAKEINRIRKFCHDFIKKMRNSTN